ncbi:MAG: DUF1330 domain-containing protein [Pseudomonadota bacterium]
MAAYWMVRSSAITDEAAMKEYGKRWPQIAERFGAKVIARGPDSTPEGPEFPRALIVEFPDLEAATACYHDAEYAEAMAFARSACERELIIIDGD